MEYIIIGFVWIILSVVVGIFGLARKLGFTGAFLGSLFCSPLLGMLFVLASPREILSNESNELSRKAIGYKEEKNYPRAIEVGKEALNLSISSPLLHLNMSCFYSLNNEINFAYIHLEKAVECGFIDFYALEKDPDLENLRKDPGYSEFLRKGYKL